MAALIAAAAALGGTFVGSLTTIWGKLYEERRKVAALRKAFRAEIAATLDISEVRRQEEKAAAFIQALRAGHDIKIKYSGVERAEKIRSLKLIMSMSETSTLI